MISHEKIFEFGFKKQALLSYEDLKSLSLNKRNRLVDEKHVREVFKGIEEWKTFPMIIVNQITSNILDGQHRHQAIIWGFEKGKIPMDTLIPVAIEVCETDEEEVEAIIRYNSHTKNWQAPDFISNHIKGGNESYKKLHEFCMSHELTCGLRGGVMKPKYRYAQAMILGKGGEANLKSGKFVASDEDFAFGDKMHGELTQVIKALGLPEKGDYIESLGSAWNHVRKEKAHIGFNKWLNALSENKHDFKAFTTKKEWAEKFKSMTSLA